MYIILFLLAGGVGGLGIVGFIIYIESLYFGTSTPKKYGYSFALTVTALCFGITAGVIMIVDLVKEIYM